VALALAALAVIFTFTFTGPRFDGQRPPSRRHSAITPPLLCLGKAFLFTRAAVTLALAALAVIFTFTFIGPRFNGQRLPPSLLFRRYFVWVRLPPSHGPRRPDPTVFHPWYLPLGPRLPDHLPADIKGSLRPLLPLIPRHTKSLFTAVLMAPLSSSSLLVPRHNQNLTNITVYTHVQHARHFLPKPFGIH
jgi:hypothetical protein